MTVPILDDLASVVEKVAPLLGAVLRVENPIVGFVLSAICSKFNVDPSKPDALIDAIEKDNQADIKLKTLELQNQTLLKQLASQDYQAAVNDRKDARTYFPQDRTFLIGFAIFITIGLFAIIFMLFFEGFNLSTAESHLVAMLIGLVGSRWQNMVDFFYGGNR